MKKLTLLFICVFFLGTFFASAQMSYDPPLIKAYFVGYDENDIVFHIVNNSRNDIKIKGLSYQKQVLYRPIEKNTIVSPSDEKQAYREVKFRTTGDFVWSENHMNQFQLAFHALEEKERSYAALSTKEVSNEK